MARTGKIILDALFSTAVNLDLIVSKFEQGRLGILFSIFSQQLADWEFIIEGYEAEFSLKTARVESHIENLSLPFHVRQEATPSRVVLTFIRDEGVDEQIKIPKNTIIETPGYNPIQYKILNDVYLYVGLDYAQADAFSIETGAKTMVSPGQLTVLNPIIYGATVTNEKASWGGTDKENIESVRQKAINARYSMEKATLFGLYRVVRENNKLENYEFSIFEKDVNPGVFYVYVDTENEDVYEGVKDTITRNKAHGMYVMYGYATPLTFSFIVTMNLTTAANLSPKDRIQLSAECKEIFSSYILQNGIGNKLYINKLIHRLYEGLLAKYDISDITIKVKNGLQRLDASGNIVPQKNEVIKINSIDVNLTFG